MYQLRNIFLALTFVAPYINYGQDVGFVSNLEMREVDQKFLISWTIDSGETCQGQNILHSSNGVDFEEVGYIYGVCGNVVQDEHYTFTHDTPKKNSINYYRIELGGRGLSQIISKYLINLEGEKSIAFPSPSSDLIQLKWANVNNQQNVVLIYGSGGVLIKKLTTINSSLELDVSDWRKGVYQYVVSFEYNDSNSKGRFVVN